MRSFPGKPVTPRSSKKGRAHHSSPHKDWSAKQRENAAAKAKADAEANQARIAKSVAEIAAICDNAIVI